MKKIFLFILTIISFSSFADTEDFVATAAPSYHMDISTSPITYVITQANISNACTKADKSATSQANSFISSMKDALPDYTFSSSNSSCDTSAVYAGTFTNASDLHSVSVTATVTYNEKSTEPETNQCTGLSSMDGAYNHVSNGYINYNGCQYESTGVIICSSSDVCAATWKPTGVVSPSGSAESSPVKDDTGGSDTGGSDTGGSDTGGSDTGGSSVSESTIASGVSKGIKDASPDLTSDIKDSLTEDDTSEQDQADADKLSDTNKANVVSNLNNLARGAAKFADSNNTGASSLGDGPSALDGAIGQADQLSISKDDHGAAWESFLNLGALRPDIPTGKGCTNFVMFQGTIYEMQIDCDKLDLIKSTLTWVVYCLTFWYVFTSLTTLLRKGEE